MNKRLIIWTVSYVNGQWTKEGNGLFSKFMNPANGENSSKLWADGDVYYDQKKAIEAADRAFKPWSKKQPLNIALLF